MDRFTIGDIENLSGIKAHTLRIWEKRYGLLTPKRKESNHRFYDNDDLKRVLRVAYLYHKGHKISKIADYEEGKIKKFTTLGGQATHLLFINRLLEAAFAFDETTFEEILNTAIERFGFEQCIIHVVYPYFEKVGLLWMTNVAVPAQEHFSSNIIRNKIILAIDNIKRTIPPSGKKMLLFTPEKEHHEMPLLFIHYLLKKHNKNIIYAGANISMRHLEEFCSIIKPDILYLHLITNFTKQHVDDYLMMLSKRFPSQKIIMGGLATEAVSIANKSWLLPASLEDFIKLIPSL